MLHTFDSREREYIFDRGWTVKKDGMLVVPKADAKRLGKSVRFPGMRTLMLPSETGCTLIIEGRHFVVEG